MKFTLNILLLVAFSICVDNATAIPAIDHHTNIERAIIPNKSPVLSKRALLPRSRKHKKNDGKKDCSKVACALVLKPCPKACPLSCGYIDSPDPCCPLLGKPTCPDPDKETDVAEYL